MWIKINMMFTAILLAGNSGMSADEQKLARVDAAMNSVMKQNCQDEADKTRKKCLELCVMRGESVNPKECSQQCDKKSKEVAQECDEEKKEAKKYLGMSDKERKKVAREAELGASGN